MKKSMLYIGLVLGTNLTAVAAAEKFTIDPSHTFPSVAVLHFGTSIYRGKFTKSSGTITLDREKKTGTAEIQIDTASIQMGFPELDTHIKSKDFLDVSQFPVATFKAASMKFSGDRVVEIPGQLTLRGVTKPVTLTMSSFNCYDSPNFKRKVCGGEASATIKRTDFGVMYGAPFPVSDDVQLLIQVEAILD